MVRLAFLLLSFSLLTTFHPHQSPPSSYEDTRQEYHTLFNSLIYFFFFTNVGFSQCLLSKSVVSHTGVFKEWAFQSHTGNDCWGLLLGGPIIHRPAPPLFLPACINHGKDGHINRPLKSKKQTFPGVPLVSPPSVLSLCLATLASTLVAVDVGFLFPRWIRGFFSCKMIPKACPEIKA